MQTKIHKKNQYCAGPNCDCGYPAKIKETKPMSHTPTWNSINIVMLTDGQGNEIQRFTPEESELIRTACNAHEDLLDALTSCKNYLDTRFEPSTDEARAALLYMKTTVNEALAKANAS